MKKLLMTIALVVSAMTASAQSTSIIPVPQKVVENSGGKLEKWY